MGYRMKASPIYKLTDAIEQRLCIIPDNSSEGDAADAVEINRPR